MRNFLTLNFLWFCVLSGGAQGAQAKDESIPDTPTYFQTSDYNLSGYTNLTFNAPAGDKATLSMDDLSLFSVGHINRGLNPFLESEIGGLTLLQQGGNPLSAGSPHFVLERLYNDSYLTNKLSLRIGKMLAPFGEWNLIHAAPLVWTTTRPMTTYHGFSEYASGASLIYSGSQDSLPDMQFYVQPGGEIHPRTLDTVVREYEDVAGFHLSWPTGLNDKIGLSFQHAQIKHTNAQQSLVGINVNKTYGVVEFEAEAHLTHISGSNDGRMRDNELGTYVQGAYGINDQWYLTGRYEYFDARSYTRASENALIGATCKSAGGSVWKIEYIEQHGQLMDIQTGLYASFSRLF